MFILATTELQKVPATILSRCQRFSFKRITPQDIRKRLLYVSSQEGIDLTEDGAELLSRLADGALRDALSLLDQCAAVGGTINSAAVLEVLGLAGNLQTAQLMERVLRRDAAGALTLLGRLYEGGKPQRRPDGPVRPDGPGGEPSGADAPGPAGAGGRCPCCRAPGCSCRRSGLAGGGAPGASRRRAVPGGACGQCPAAGGGPASL